MIYGFTATRDLRPQHTRPILELLEELTDGTEYITGAARGGDTFIARALTELYPLAVHRLIVPDGGHNEELVEGWLPNHRRLIQRMPPGTTFKDRNAVIVARSDRVAAVPLYDESRQPRSGTWQTVRMARKARKLYRLLTLEPDETMGSATMHGSLVARGRSRAAPFNN